MWEGDVVSIHVATEASAPMRSITEVRAFPGRGLEGDRYFAGTGYYLAMRLFYFSGIRSQRPSNRA